MPVTAARLIAIIEAAGYKPHPHDRGGTLAPPCVGFTDDDPLDGDDPSPQEEILDGLAAFADGQAEHLAFSYEVGVTGAPGGTVFYWPDVPWPCDDGDAAEAGP